MHDPYQTNPYQTNPYQTNPYQTAGWGVATPFGLPFGAAQNPTINPLGAFGGQTAGIPQLPQQIPGISGYGQGIYPQQLQAAFPGMIPQFGGISPYGGLQNPLLANLLQNPLVLAQLQNQLLGGGLQNALGGPSNPQAFGQSQNPFLSGGLQNAPGGLQNPLMTSGLQNPLVNPMLAQGGLGGSPFGWHQQSPYHQLLGQFGQQQLPQTWLGQPAAYGGGIPFGRGFQQPGISPWTYF